MGEQVEEDAVLSWAQMFSDEALQSADTVKVDGKSTGKSNFVVVAEMKFSTSQRTSNVMASAAKLASDVLDDIAHKNAGVDRGHLQKLQESTAIQLKSDGDRTDKVRALAEVMDGLSAVENASPTLKNVSNDLGRVDKTLWIWRTMDRSKFALYEYDVVLNVKEVTAGDFTIRLEEQNKTLVICIENIKHTLENEYATVFVQLRQRSFARDFFCVLTKTQKCTLGLSGFNEWRRLHVAIRPVAVTLPAMLKVLAESFEASKHLSQADERIDKIIVAKDTMKKKLIAEISKLRDDNTEKDRKLDEAHAEIEVLKEQLKGWQDEVIGISERIKLKAMPGMRRVVLTSNVSTSSTANFSDFEKIYEVPASEDSATDAN
ncbi:hypothetical protein AAVH_10539 [Aphelenchoides avenae]|nr:hypothetical protein AAVH_10539 [Aphelenchus avenae]